MDDADVTPPGPTPEQIKAAKDINVAFKRGVAMGTIEASCVSLVRSTIHATAIAEQMRLRNDECAKLDKLCQDYERYSSNLDGSVLEILHKVQEGISKDAEFFKNQCMRHYEDLVAIHAKLSEMTDKLEQTLDEE